MNNDDRMFFLASNPVNSRWDLRDGGQLWTVTVFFAVGHGWSFAEALDDAIRVYAEREAGAVAMRWDRVRPGGWRGSRREGTTR